MLIVRYQVIDSGVVLEQKFDSPYICRKFINKLKHSKRCRLIMAPNI